MTDKGIAFYQITLGALDTQLAQLEDARASLTAEYKAELDRIDGQIAHVKSGIVSISRLIDDNKTSSRNRANVLHGLLAKASLTTVIREVLKSRDGFWSPPEIRDGLENVGYDLTRHSNPLASIHTCLKRLTKQGEISAFDDNGKTVYEWKSRGRKLR